MGTAGNVTYKPTPGTDRTISFVLKDGVSLYGGFLGTETLRSERASSASLTILSGEIGVTGDATDNSYHVVVANGVTNTTNFDGFTITAGYAGGPASDSFGAGMYNDAGSPILNNIVFDSNTASSPDTPPAYSAGGGMYNINGNPTLTKVIFSNNSASQTVVGSGGMLGPGNSSYGGGMYNKNGTVTLTDITFSNNQTVSVTLGESGDGGGMYNESSILVITNATFENNKCTVASWPGLFIGCGGGGIESMDSSVTINHALFNGNKSGYGGGMYITVSSSSPSVYNLTMNDVVFSNNTGIYSGGGLRSEVTNTSITNVTFSENQSYYSGGGMFNLSPTGGNANTVTLTNVTFRGNRGGKGGGLNNSIQTGTLTTLTNVTFKDNTSDSYAGGMMTSGEGVTTLNHVTFNGNTDLYGGGALYNNASGNNNPTISNSIFWGDSSEIFNLNQDGYISTPIIKDSVISTGCPAGATCTNIITTDPKLGPLADNGGLTQTMALGAGSSAIDTGGQNSTCATNDQRGVPRPQGAGCDIGAYEAVTSMLVNSVLPTSRSVQVGSTATIFHTVINPNANAVQNVTLFMANAPAGAFAYQQTNCNTNALIGPMNPTLDIPEGGMICYILMFTPSVAFNATGAYIRVESNAVPVSNLYSGINTWLLRATSIAGPDIIAQTTTADLHQLACSGAIAFAVATSNVGAAATGDITVSANTGSASLPVSVSINETNPGTGAIIGDNILQSVGAGDNRTVAVFVTFNGCIPFDPAANRIFIEFRDASNNVVGSTSTAVSTNR